MELARKYTDFSELTTMIKYRYAVFFVRFPSVPVARSTAKLFCDVNCRAKYYRQEAAKERIRELTCEHCGKEFTTTRNSVKYCSDDCRVGTLPLIVGEGAFCPLTSKSLKNQSFQMIQ